MVVSLSHVPGKFNVADLLTKAVSRAIYLALMQLIAEYAATGVASM